MKSIESRLLSLTEGGGINLYHGAPLGIELLTYSRPVMNHPTPIIGGYLPPLCQEHISRNRNNTLALRGLANCTYETFRALSRGPGSTISPLRERPTIDLARNFGVKPYYKTHTVRGKRVTQSVICLLFSDDDGGRRLRDKIKKSLMTPPSRIPSAYSPSFRGESPFHMSITTRPIHRSGASSPTVWLKWSNFVQAPSVSASPSSPPTSFSITMTCARSRGVA